LPKNPVVTVLVIVEDKDVVAEDDTDVVAVVD